MAVPKRTLLAAAAALATLTACVPPPTPTPVRRPAPPTTEPSPAYPQLCSETGRSPSAALGSERLQGLGRGSLGLDSDADHDAGEATVALETDASGAPELPGIDGTLDAEEVRSAAELAAAEPQELPGGGAAALVLITVSAIVDGHPQLDTVVHSDPAVAVQQTMDFAQAVWAAGGEVIAVEPDGVVEAPAAGEYPVDDAYRDEQWSFDMFGFEDTWCASTGAGVKLAVVDSGVDHEHPDLAGKVTSRVDMSLDPALGNGMAGKPGLHGTHVAGTIAAIPNNGIGVAGVAPGVEIIDVKALTAEKGLGSQGFTAKAIVHAVEQGVDVINLSVGFPCDPTPDGSFTAQDPSIESCAGNGAAALEVAAAYAKANDVVMVVAAGNDGSPTTHNEGGDEVPNTKHNVWSVPGAIDSSLTVGSMAADRTMSVFSTQASYVDIAGPGSDVLSTVFDEEGPTYDMMSGTSMATPHVAGLVAVLRGAFPSEDAAAIVARVTSSAAPFGTGDTADDSDGCPSGTAKQWCFGSGVIDPAAAVRQGRS